jgi:hypothetical protein
VGHSLNALGGELATVESYGEVSHSDDRTGGADVAQVLIEELLRTGLSLSGAVASLLEDLPEEAFPGEDNAAVLIEMIAGSCRPAIEAAGERDCWAAVALMGAVRDRFLADLRAAAELARPDR